MKETAQEYQNIDRTEARKRQHIIKQQHKNISI